MLTLLAIALAQTYTPGHVSFGGDLNYCPGLNASIDAYHGVATGGPIFPNASGLGLQLVGRRRDQVAQVNVGAEVWVDGGVVFGVNSACGYSAPPLFSVTTDGVQYGWTMNADCTGNGNVFAGGLVDNSGVSGHFSLRSAPGNLLTVGGHLSPLHAMLPNGEQPDPANYPAGWVMTDELGRHYFPYAGLHGSVSIATVDYQPTGFIATFDNNGHPVYSHRAGIDANGGYFQSHWLTREQFPSPLVETTMTSLGQFRYMMASTLYYAFDTKHWYFTDGSRWVQLAEQADVDARIIAIEARLAALEAR